MSRSRLAAAVVGLGVAAGAATGAPDADPEAALRRFGSPCADAGLAEVSVPVGIDEVRVVVSDGLPGAAAAVTVLAGERDRQLTTFGGGRWALAMNEPLPAGKMVIAVEPVLDAPIGACVQRVELVHGGTVIASARPR